ncbi:MAG: peptidoglycan-binding protein [Hasllibacter sp.]
MTLIRQTLAATALALAVPGAAAAHGGRADANGCHWDFLYYHCHQIQQAPRSQATAPRQPAPQPARPVREPVREDPRRVLVRQVQRALTDLGCQPGPIDGAEGPSTRAAIERYEAAFGYPVIGAPSDALLRRIRADRPRAGAGTCAPVGGAISVTPLDGGARPSIEAAAPTAGLDTLPPAPNDPGRPTLTGFPTLVAGSGRVPHLDFDGVPVRLDGVAAAPGLTAEADLRDMTAAVAPEPHVTCELTAPMGADGMLVGQCRANAADIGERLVLAGAALDCPAESAGRYATAEQTARGAGRIPVGVRAGAACGGPADAGAGSEPAIALPEADLGIGGETLEILGQN